ncbi:MAG: bifunctional riboflavin kinase/FAD synthetase [Kiritimatiellae bacterium]|nr:bifunctional riboflavin kinase/FAD synthetase [Kiritimatiellia bacterium]
MILAVGFFDGVHIGHRAILSGADAALTFRRHPLSLLAPERAPNLLMSTSARLDAIRACAVKEVRALDFTPAFALMEPEDFAARLPSKSLRCGENWRFGKGGRGDADLLRRLGFDVTVVPYEKVRGEPVSSTRIRAAVAAGDMELAAEMLGRPFSLSGRVFAGKGEGRIIGFPTVNVAIDLSDGPSPLAAPPFGVYAVVAGGRKAVANWGFAPTMGARAWKEAVLEVHFLEGDDFSVPDGSPVCLRRFIRFERKFDSPLELAASLRQDCEEALK